MDLYSLDPALKESFCLLSLDNIVVLITRKDMQSNRSTRHLVEAINKSGFKHIFQSPSPSDLPGGNATENSDSKLYFNNYTIELNGKGYAGLWFDKSHENSALFVEYCKGLNIPHCEFAAGAPDADIIDFISRCDKARGGQAL
jgi:hypothetical protein